MHRLLERQLRRFFGSADAAPAALWPFIAAVDAAYAQADDDRRMLERSLELTSQEMVERYRLLEADTRRRERLEEQLRQAQKMDAMGRLAGGVAHDFNNVLTAISGYCDLLALGLSGDPARLADVDEIRRAAERASSLTRRLLALSRRQVLEPRVLALGDVVVGLHPMLRRLLGETVEVTTLPAADAWPALADQEQLEHVLVNLAVNARDAMPQGGRLVIRVENARVEADDPRRPAGAPPGDYAAIAVIDRGGGMSDEAMAHLFEPFFTTKPRGKGTGLGLATCYGIVRQAGGFIDVRSAAGEGTTVTIFLPRTTEAPSPPRVEEAAPESAGGGREAVLLVEDDPALREVVARVLRSLGYSVLEASDGEEALRVARAAPGPIDLLFTDVVLPRLGGREVAAGLAGERPAMRALFMSGYLDDSGAAAALPAFLAKPFTTAALARKVREVLDAPRA